APRGSRNIGAAATGADSREPTGPDSRGPTGRTDASRLGRTAAGPPGGRLTGDRAGAPARAARHLERLASSGRLTSAGSNCQGELRRQDRSAIPRSATYSVTTE